MSYFPYLGAWHRRRSHVHRSRPHVQASGHGQKSVKLVLSDVVLPVARAFGTAFSHEPPPLPSPLDRQNRLRSADEQPSPPLETRFPFDRGYCEQRSELLRDR